LFNVYKKEYRIYSEHHNKAFIKVLFIGVVVTILSFTCGFLFEDFIIDQANNIASEVGNQNNVESTNFQSFISTLTNNIFLSLIIICSGFIPIYGLPIVFSIASFAAVGILASYGVIMDKDVLKTMSLAFLPHAIIEVIPIVYSITIGLYINKTTVRKVFRKNTSSNLSSILIQSLNSILIIIIPLFIIAALVESYITTLLIEKYL
jgi:stage II sporulation protein M